MFIDSRVLRALASEGMTMHDMAKAMGVPYIRVRRAFAYYCSDVEVMQEARGRPDNVASDIRKLVTDPRIERVKVMVGEGKTRNDAMQALGITRPTLKRLEEKAGVSFIHGRTGLQDMDRAEKMASMYRQGLSLEKIGASFGLTRERVRQVLAKQGTTRNEGGASKRKQVTAAALQAKRDARYLARHGITFSKWQELRGTGLLQRYRNQEHSAKARGIEWGLNLAQWLEIWETSGKMHLRGRGKGKYLMSRIKDSGGYVIGNVHIQLATDNSREAVDKWRDSEPKEHRGVFHLYPGLSKPYVAKMGRVLIGSFATEHEAVAARVAYAAEHGLRLEQDGRISTKAANGAHEKIFAPAQPVIQAVSQ